MYFMSDNAAGAAPEIIDAIARVSGGTAASYGADDVSARLTRTFSDLFDRDVAVFPVATGTAANSLALATLTPHYGAVFCHEGAHIHVDECGAPEFYSGAKLVPVKGHGGKLTPAAVQAQMAHFNRGFVHHVQPASISITQATELGTSYTPAEVRAIGDFARSEKLVLHMDGARFANAVSFLGCHPADITWKAGVDALSFGATKNGALAAEAVIFFDPGRAADFAYRRKKAGHLFSKMRFLSAQIEAMLDNGLWLRLAAHANLMARRLAAGLDAVPGITIEHPVESNEVFARLPSEAMKAALESKGARFYLWEPMTDGRPLIRLVCSFATSAAEVDALVAAASGLAGSLPSAGRA